MLFIWSVVFRFTTLSRGSCAEMKALVNSSAYVVLLVYIALHICVQGEDNVKIKIVQAPALSRFPAMPNSQKKLTLRAKPANVTGPHHLQLLNGTCFKGSQNKYNYEVCPFQNVTQTEGSAGWSSFHGVLGVWYEWLFTNDTFAGMHFMMGEPCGTMDREVKVLFNCSTVTRVHNASEPSTCKYVIWLDTPLACFKGVMQVYHLLSAKQLEQWDEAEQEFYNEEITYQGLEKRRRHILTECGFLQKPAVKQKDVEQETPLVPAETNSEEVSLTNKLNDCLQDNKALEQQLKHLKNKFAVLQQEYPHIAVSLGRASNLTSNQKSNGPGVHTMVDTQKQQDSVQDVKHKKVNNDDPKLFYDYLYSLAQQGNNEDIVNEPPELSEENQSEINKENSFDNLDVDRQLSDLLSRD